MQIAPFFTEKSTVNAKLVAKSLAYTLQTRLFTDFTDIPMLFSESDTPNPAFRRDLTEKLFEKMHIPAVFFSPISVLAAYGTGRCTALVVHSGAHRTSVAPVYDGYIVPRTMLYWEVGGETLTQMLGNSIDEMGVEVRPGYMVKKTGKWRSDPENTFEITQITPRIHPLTHISYHNFMRTLLIRDIKETISRVSDTPYSPDCTYPTPAGDVSEYELPDGRLIDLNREKYRIPEVLFTGLKGFKGVHELAYDAIQLTDPDIRKDLYSNVVFSGGNTLLPGFQERVLKKLLDMALPTVKVKSVVPMTPAERRFGAWQGGAVVASLESFRGMWVRREEYLEHGQCVVTKKPCY